MDAEAVREVAVAGMPESVRVRNPRFRQDFKEWLVFYSALTAVSVIVATTLNSQLGFFVFLGGSFVYGLRMLLVGEQRRRDR
jgi:hypothetical protein